MIVLDEVHFRCEDQKSRTVADQFEWRCRVDPEIMQRHIFDFRLHPQTESMAVLKNRKSEPGVENILDEKIIKF